MLDINKFKIKPSHRGQVGESLLVELLYDNNVISDNSIEIKFFEYSDGDKFVGFEDDSYKKYNKTK